MINVVKKAVIFAGGLGTRLKPWTRDNQKAMYPINGRPFLCYLIEQVKGFGIDEIIILLGYKAESVIGYFCSIGKKKENVSSIETFIQKVLYNGLSLIFITTPIHYDTNLRLLSAKEYLYSDFLMMYCDNICPIDFEMLVNNFYKHNAMIEITAYENKDMWTKDNLIVNDNGKVLLYDKKREKYNLHGVDIGYAIVSKKIFEMMKDENVNFEAYIYHKLINDSCDISFQNSNSDLKEGLYATFTKHRYYSIGSYERIEQTKEFLSDRKFIFLDRDGTINVKPKTAEYIKEPNDFIWLNGSKEAIKLLCDNDYRVLIATNQAGIGRGIITLSDFDAVNKKMETDLNEIGAKIDKIYFCPHNWNENCDCRKPKTGMLYQAQKDYNIDLTKCVFIGDDERDIEMAMSAGMKGMLVDEKYSLLDAVKEVLKINKN